MPQNTYSDYLKFQKDKEMNSKKDELSALKVQHELEAFQRVLSKEGGSRTDSVTVGYPVSSLSKRIAAPEDISDANIESLLSYYRNAPLETGQDDVVMQAVTDELIRRFGTSQNTTKDNTKAVLKPKTKAKTKDKKPVKLPFLWKNQLNNARRAVENDKSEKTTIKSYLNERKWSNEQIIAATIRDQTGN